MIEKGGGDYVGFCPCLVRITVLLMQCVPAFLVDAVALIVQIHLQQNRNDLALKEVASARRWAQDSILVNLAESWVGLRQVCIPPSS